MYLGNSALPFDATHEQAVARAAHLFDCGLDFHVAKVKLTAEGVTRTQMGEGYRLAKHRKDERRLQVGISGNPEYGGSAQDEKLNRMLER